MIYGLQFIIVGEQEHMVYGLWFMVYGLQFTVYSLS